MAESQKRVIGDYEYEVSPLGAREASRVLTRVLSKLGASVQNISSKDATAMLGAIAQHVSEDDVDYIIGKFIPCTRVNLHANQPASLLTPSLFDTHFSQRSLEMFQWIAFCFEVNFSGFFEGLRSKLGAVAAPTPIKSSS